MVLRRSDGVAVTKWRIAPFFSIIAVHPVLDHAHNLFRELTITQLPIWFEPRAGPVDHAEHHHGERGLVLFRRSLWIRARKLPGERRDNAALALQHDFTLRIFK